MKDSVYTKMMTEAPFGAAYHKIILDDKGKPVDYVFLEVNKAFERLTGLRAKDILNKRITEAMPGIEKGEFSWIDYFGRVALDGKSQDFEQYSEPLKRWYKVFAYSPQKNYFVTIFTDTTKEKMLREELDRFFSINLDLLCIADTDGNFVKVNKSWDDILGYSSDELEKKKFLSFVHPDDMQDTLDALQELKANKPVMNFVNRYRSKDGSYRHIEWRSHPYGQYIYAAARDVTDRLKSETKLRDMEKRLAAAQNFASVGSWEYNINDGMLYWSKECEALFGLEEGEFEGTFEDFLKRVHPDDKELVINTNQPITEYKDPIPLEYEHRIITKSGGIRWVRESAGLMKDTLGKPKKIAGLMMDITRQKEAEARLVNSEKRYRGLVESQSDLIVRVDNQNRFTFVNDAYCKAFGKSCEELIGQSFTPLVHEDDIALTLEAMKDLEKPPYRCQIVQRAMTKDGWRWIQWEDNAILDGDGNILEIQGVGRDITNIKEVEDALRVSELRMKSLLAETPAVVYSYGFKNGAPNIDYINENVENILGFKPEHFLHNFEAWVECVHPEDLKKNQERLAETLNNPKDGLETYYEYRFKDRDGNYHWLSDRQKVLIDSDGNIKGVGVWVDITKEIEAREAIENEERLRQIVDNIDGVFWLRSADRHEMLYVSPSVESMFGISQQELYENPNAFTNPVHPEDKERVQRALAKFMETGIFMDEFRVVKPDGEIRWMVSKAFPVKNEQGRTIRFAGIVNDITQQVQATQKLRETTERYKGVLNHSPLLISEFDLDGNYLLVNNTIAALFKKSEDEIIGKHFGQFLSPETVSLFNDRIAKIKATGERLEVEDKLIVDNEAVYFSTVLFPLFDDSGKIQSIGSIANNITATRLATESLAQSEEMFRQISESMGEVFWLRSGDDKKMLYVNPAYEKVFGRSCQSLYDEPNSFFDAILDEDKGKFLAALKEGKETGIFEMEYRIVTPDNQIKWLHAQSFPVYNEKGEIVRTTGLATEVTNRKNAEQALIKAKEKAEESDRLKSAFLAAVNHELRTPLNHILGFSEIIRSSSDDADIQDFSGIIYDSGRRFLAMVEDIFDLALVEQGEVRMRKQSIKMADLFLEHKHSLEEVLNESEKSNDIKLSFKPESDFLMSTIASDRLKISQVLTNLFRNAVKFTNKGVIEYGFYTGNENTLVFYVRDTGIGIPADKLDIIFDFFRQVDDSHTRLYEGLGIGLAISRQIARAMDGELSVKSEEGTGTTFYFSIPLVMSGQAKQASRPCTEARACDFSGKTVLIAEDDKDGLIIIKQMLKSTNINTLEASNGREAVRVFASNPGIDLVLMDIKMPIMDGYEATRQIKAANTGVPVLAITAYGLLKDKERALAAGCDAIVTKPVNQDLLMHALKKHLGVE